MAHAPAAHAPAGHAPAAPAPAAHAPPAKALPAHVPAAKAPAAKVPAAAHPAPAPTTSVAGPVAQRSWTCATGHSVSVAVVAGAGDQWPGSTARSAGPDEPSGAFDATAWLWSHLRTTRTS